MNEGKKGQGSMKSDLEKKRGSKFKSQKHPQPTLQLCNNTFMSVNIILDEWKMNRMWLSHSAINKLDLPQ